jgi:hypothetical membrane protein
MSLWIGVPLTLSRKEWLMTRHRAVPESEGGSRLHQLDRWLALGGVDGPALFVLTFTIAGMLRPAYSPLSQAISDLGVGDDSWIVNGSLVLLGVLLVGFAITFYRMVRPRTSAAVRFVCASLIALVGVGYAVAGLFPETTPIHWLVGATGVYAGAALGFLATGLLLRGDPAWRGWAVYSLLASLATVALVALTFYTYAPSVPPVARLGGHMERVVFLEILAWYVAFGWRLFGRSKGETLDTSRRQQ